MSKQFTGIGQTRLGVCLKRLATIGLIFTVLLQLQHESTLLQKMKTLMGGTISAVDMNPGGNKCSFRDYNGKRARLYGLTDETYPMSFLRVGFYIYGQPPVLLPVAENQAPSPGSAHMEFLEGKVCNRPSPGHLESNPSNSDLKAVQLDQPLMDGTNPTLISFERIRSEIPSQEWFPWKELLQDFPTAAFVVSSSFKKAHQCDYDPVSRKNSTAPKLLPGRQHTTEVDILIVDQQLKTLHQTTLQEVNSSLTDGVMISNTFPADDGRLLVHDGAIWVTYKRYGNDGGLGYVLYAAELKFQYHAQRQTPGPNLQQPFQAYAVDEFIMCCGRNFGALSAQGTAADTSGQLSFLTWPDPVWVQSIDTASSNRTFGFQKPTFKSKNAFGKSSGFHGTSGFLLYLPETDEYLGIGHIHRDRRWSEDLRVDAKFGHHYTHAFFTISGRPPFVLRRLSAEFLFPSKMRNHSQDADIIQFASGLEWVPGTRRQQMAIAYGINDCEGAVVYIDRTLVERWLRPLGNETQVAHTMTRAPVESFRQHVNNSSRP